MPSLLDMPAEIRNEIYQYALTDTAGLRVRSQATRNRCKKKPVMHINDLDTGVVNEDQPLPINQMMYVCKLLRKETAGLEVQYNDVTFTSTSSTNTGAMWGFTQFIERCTPTRLAWLRKVILDEGAELATAHVLG